MKNSSRIAIISFVSLLVACSFNAQSQTIYKKGSGFFTPVLKSFYLSENLYESTQKIGPAIGYRFNDHIDVSVHTEFLFRERKSTDINLSLLNLGIIGGYSTPLSDRLTSRTELSFYNILNLKNSGSFQKRSLHTALASTSLYWKLPLVKNVSFMPSIGALIGYGRNNNTRHNVNPISFTQNFNGFVWGPRAGLELLFKLSKGISLNAGPSAKMFYNYRRKTYVGFNIGFNF